MENWVIKDPLICTLNLIENSNIVFIFETIQGSFLVTPVCRLPFMVMVALQLPLYVV